MSSISLCLACSSSLPPKASESEIFITACCNQPICPNCIIGNPRLARYNPCLSCLGGVGVVAASKAGPSGNMDGSIRDQDVFSLGDDEDDDASEEDEAAAENAPPEAVEPSGGPPSKYYLKQNDTLKGILLRFGIDGHELCRLNNMPPSTLSTTPHLLHTRTFLIFPESALSKLQALDTTAEGRVREVRRARERAAKRLQTLTKETDWRVAKAYLALADDSSAMDAFALKQKELGGGSGARGLEAIAVDQYLDDLEWEAEQLKAGRAPRILPIPDICTVTKNTM